MKRIAILALAGACVSANALTFSNVTLSKGANLVGTLSAPAQAGNSFNFTLTGAGSNGGATLNSNKSANLNWDYKVSATPGYKITGITLTYQFYTTAAGLKAIESNFKVWSGASNVGSPVWQLPAAQQQTYGAGGPFTFSVSSGALNLSSAYVSQTTTFLNFSNLPIEIVGGGTTVTQQAVPEPASMAALAIGGFGLLRRRRKA